MADSLSNPGSPAPAAPGIFPPTSWTLVERALASGEEARGAFDELLGRYWRPIFLYLRRNGRQVAEAEDQTQSFFAHLIEKRLLERVRTRQVRLRAFLRGVLEHWLANDARTAAAKKRASGVMLDIASAEAWLATCADEPPGAAFDRMWALDRLEAAWGRLSAECRQAGRGWAADALAGQVGLGSSGEPAAIRELCVRHGVDENRMSVALHRARKRLRELILDEIRRTSETAEEAEAEFRELLGLMGGPAKG